MEVGEASGLETAGACVNCGCEQLKTYVNDIVNASDLESILFK